MSSQIYDVKQKVLIMIVSSMSQYWARTPVNETPVDNAAAKPAETQSTTTPNKSAPKQTPADVFAKYDMNAISPREVDQMADELLEAGFKDMEFLLMFTTQGEKFLTHLQETARQHGIGGAGFDPTKPMDLITQTKTQLAFASAAGDPTDAMKRFLDMLMHPPQQTTAVTQNPALAQSVFDANTA